MISEIWIEINKRMFKIYRVHLNYRKKHIFWTFYSIIYNNHVPVKLIAFFLVRFIVVTKKKKRKLYLIVPNNFFTSSQTKKQTNMKTKRSLSIMFKLGNEKCGPNTKAKAFALIFNNYRTSTINLNINRNHNLEYVNYAKKKKSSKW